MKVIEKIKEWLSKDKRALWAATLSMVVMGLVAITYISPYENGMADLYIH